MRYIVVPIHALASERAEPARVGEARPGAGSARAYDAGTRATAPTGPPAGQPAERGWDTAVDLAVDLAGHTARATDSDRRWDSAWVTPGDALLDAAEETPERALASWVDAARASLDACLVVDAVGTVAGLSATAADLLGTEPQHLVGQRLDDVLNLVDFTDVALEARGTDRRIPPLIAVRENSLSRGMMRLRRPDGNRLMLDAVAAPIHDGERNPIGAVSFLASI